MGIQSLAEVALCTGAAGSIGSSLAKELLNLEASQVRAFDVDENGLFNLKEDLRDPRLKIIIGDVRDRFRIREVMQGVDTVYHLAALKHVETCELEPIQAVTTNVIGTANAIEAALTNGISRFLTISTDKAVYPIGAYGATKLLSEIMTLMANKSFLNKGTRLSVARFGNVLGTRGSVISIWKKQLEKREPLTITDGAMKRFFWSMAEAVEFILKVRRRMAGGEIFIPTTMKEIDIHKLAMNLTENISSWAEVWYPTRVIGIRPGESFVHSLITSEEKARATEEDGMWIVR